MCLRGAIFTDEKVGVKAGARVVQCIFRPENGSDRASTADGNLRWEVVVQKASDVCMVLGVGLSRHDPACLF